MFDSLGIHLLIVFIDAGKLIGAAGVAVYLLVMIASGYQF